MDPTFISPLTSGASSFTSDEKQSESSNSLSSTSSVASPFGSLQIFNSACPMHGWEQDNSRFYRSASIDQQYIYPNLQNGSTGASHLLDTGRWSPPSNPVSYATPGMQMQFPITFMMETHCTSPEEPFATESTAARTTALESRVTQYSQAVSDLSWEWPISTRPYHADLGADITTTRLSPGCHPPPIARHPDHHAFTSNNAVPSPSSSLPISTTHRTNLVRDERQRTPMIYRAQEKTNTGRRHCQRACAIKVGGMWIDKADLHAGALQGSGMITVHECRWTGSGDLCGMWIGASKFSVGAHIRKWHPQRPVDSGYSCLWDGCKTTKAMLRDSVNRHVVTVHFGEVFHCQGCRQVFPRKDVYNQHVKGDEACRDAGAAILYNTGHREINTHQVLQQEFTGDAVRFATQ